MEELDKNFIRHLTNQVREIIIIITLYIIGITYRRIFTEYFKNDRKKAH